MFDFLEDLGEFLGAVVVFFYGLTILNYVVKFGHRKYRSLINKRKSFASNYMKIMRFIVKNHRYFGLLSVVFVLMHFSIQYMTHGLSVTGLIAALLMIMQVVLGVYGHRVKKKGKTWLTIHRSVALLLLIAIAIHIE